VSKWLETPAGALETPQMTTLDVARVGCVNDDVAAGTGRGVFELETARRQQSRRAPGCRHGVEVQPAIILRREHEQLPTGPEELLI